MLGLAHSKQNELLLRHDIGVTTAVEASALRLSKEEMGQHTMRNRLAGEKPSQGK